MASETDQIDLDAQPLAKVGYDLYKDLIQTSSQAGLPLSITKQSKTNWAPRLGVAWRPFGEKTVVRAGYGIFYETEGTSGRLNFNFLPFNVSETVNADRDVLPTRTTANFFLGAPFGSAVTNAAWVPVPLTVRSPYDQHWNFGVQQQLMPKLVFEVNYVGNKGLFLPDTNNINFPNAGAGTIQTRRPYPRFGTIAYNTQDAASIYHSLQMKMEKRLSAGFWTLVAYTFSKSITNTATPAVGGNYGWERALTGFDVPHNFNISFGYDVPFGKGRRFLNTNAVADKIIGGWQLQGITGFRSGTPYTPTVSRDTSNTGVGGQAPQSRGFGQSGQSYARSLFRQSRIRRCRPISPGAIQAGTSCARTTLRISIFLSSKFSRSRERSKLQFRAEVFNLPNTAYFNTPNTNMDVAAGGKVTSTANTPRQMQLALKLNF